MKISESKKGITATGRKTATNATVNPVTVSESTEMGEVLIHENVIISLVRHAALAIEGVYRLSGSTLVDNIAEIVGSRRMQSRAITVDMDGDNRVSVGIKINIKLGYNVPMVAQAVQKSVIEKVEEATSMTVTKVNVIVQEIEDPAVEEDSEEEGSESGSVLPLP